MIVPWICDSECVICFDKIYARLLQTSDQGVIVLLGRECDSDTIQTILVVRSGSCAAAIPCIESDVVMIPTRRDEECALC
ncbi:MAG: hypothetical protein H6766_06450 [Candidatus Peribacteria bacterium]|nr:MAG: hypothetical protein H6766_06450 [Candidatus Peribacteria bacterium]